MMTPKSTRRFAAAALVLAGLATNPARGQTASGNDGSGTGLNALGDDALLMELAGRNMRGLLDHAFDAKKVPEQQRLAMMALPAIRRLGDTNDPPKPHERVELINQIAAGADRIIATIDDPAVLMEQASALIKFGVEPDVNLMEYWGETPKVRDRLRPVAETVGKMLDKAVKTGSARRTELENQIARGRSERLERQWTEVDQLVTMAEYTRAMIAYNKAMALPGNVRGVEQRKKEVDPAIEFLRDYDNADSGVQAAVRNRIAKLNMVKREYGAANELFETVVSGQVDDKTKLEPAANPGEQYEARYFSVVCELLQGDIPRATKGLKDLEVWQKEVYIPAARKNFMARRPPPAGEEIRQFEKGIVDGLQAAAQMLQYRIAMKVRDRAKDPAAKKAAEDQAFAVLLDLSQKQPELRAIIAEQIIEMMGDAVDLKKAELLVLQALVSRGAQVAEAVGDDGKPDAQQAKQMEQAIEAAREVISRKDPKVTNVMRGGMAIQIPLLLEKLGRKFDAVNAYLDYIERKQGNERNMKAAFERAGFLLTSNAGRGMKDDPAHSRAWERFLPIAVDQFGHKEFAFDYAMRLRAKNPPRYADAIKYFRMVPPDDRLAATARYHEMNTLTDWVYATGPDRKPLLNPKEREAKSQEALKIADDVRRLTNDALKRATDPGQQAALRARIAGVTITEAELAATGVKPDWNRVLKTLEDFEGQSKGLETAPALNKRAMELRVQSYIQLKQFNKAADALIALLQKEPGGRAAALVLGVSQRLRDDYDRAMAEGNTKLGRELIADLASLSGSLVKWASDTKNANLYVYRVYDADTQRLYGSSLDGDAKAKQLQKAMGMFKDLRSPESLASYKTYVAERKKDNPQDKTDPEQPDPAVALFMALTSYDLADWKTAAAELRALRHGNKLGNRTKLQTDDKNGEVRVVPNDQYWEAMYKYYDATAKWAKAEPDSADAKRELEAVKTLLRRDYVAGPDEAGGTKWREGFERLRKELAPDLNLEDLRSTDPATQPATQQVEPVAAGVRNYSGALHGVAASARTKVSSRGER